MAEIKLCSNYQSGEYRACYVRGKKALFHRWGDKVRVYPEQMSNTVGIVEFEDGTVDEVFPREIRFDCNQRFGEMAWFREKFEPGVLEK